MQQKLNVCDQSGQIKLSHRLESIFNVKLLFDFNLLKIPEIKIWDQNSIKCLQIFFNKTQTLFGSSKYIK